MASLVNRDYADKRFLRVASPGLVRVAGAGARFGWAMMLGVLVLFGLIMTSASGIHPSSTVMTDPGMRIDRG